LLRQGWLSVGDDRRATVSGDVIALELRLTGTPDASWVDAFRLPRAARSEPFANMGPEELPRIVGDLICWSVRTSELRIAWQYLIRCLEHANFRRSASVREPSQVPSLVTASATGSGTQHASEVEPR
jgi:hypothetical protein